MKDVRYAFRTLRRSPWYSAMVVCVLGVSMGLATVVFAVVDGVLFWKSRPTTRVVAAAVVVVAAIGTLIPSMRAARVDPVHALRAE